VQGFRESEDILRARGPMDEIKVNIILDAVANDQIDRLREILRNPTLDATEVNQAAAVAARAVKPLCVTLLVGAGADPKVIRPHFQELVTKAAGEGSFDALKSLLAMGADPNAPNKESDTPLFASAAYGHVSCVNLLLKAGADPNKRGHGKITPLQVAAAFGNASVVEALLEAGADVFLEDPRGRGLPQFLAHKHGHQDLAAMIREHALAIRKINSEL
jgi:ankyrin repeat protein